MNLEYEDARITCSNCGHRYFVEVGMSPCPNCSGLMGGRAMTREDTSMGWYEPESECTADVGVMGHLGCNNPNCSCKATDEAERVSQVFAQSVSYESYEPEYKNLKYKEVVHQTDKAMLFSIKYCGAAWEVWVPKSCVKKLTKKKVAVPRSFYYQSVLRQLKEQGCKV